MEKRKGAKCLTSHRKDGAERESGEGVLDTNVRVDVEGYRSSLLSVSFLLMKSGARPSLAVRRARRWGGLRRGFTEQLPRREASNGLGMCV